MENHLSAKLSPTAVWSASGKLILASGSLGRYSVAVHSSLESLRIHLENVLS